MKKLLILIVMTSCIAAPFTGCKSTKTQEVVFKAEGTLIYTVNTTMSAWADYCKAGKATTEQKQTVKAAYVKYYNAQQLAEAALKVYVANTNYGTAAAFKEAEGSVVDSAAALFALINSFKH